jgi:VanZ family protein
VLQFLLLVIALIVYGSLYPFHFELTARAAYPVTTILGAWPTHWSRYLVRDVLINVMIYIPLGFAAAMLFIEKRLRPFAPVFAIALACFVSTAMEFTQLYIPVRDPSVADIVANTGGGALGALIAMASERKLRRLLQAPARGLRGAAAVLLLMWVIAEFYPFMPAIGRSHIYAALHHLMHGARPSWVAVWLGVAEWAAVGLALEAIFARRATVWLALLIAGSLAAQAIIADHTLDAGDVMSAAIGFGIWFLIPAALRGRALVLLLASAILLRQLQPFHFDAAPHAFSWMPFEATFESVRESALVIIARKAFDYGALVFALHAIGWRYWRAGLTVAIPLLITEGIQTWLPQRSPEITDPLVALMMMGIMMLTSPQKGGTIADTPRRRSL